MTIDEMDDAVAAAAFRRLVRHLRHRSDAQNVDLMGLAGFCRNCLSDWVAEACGLNKDEAREAIYGMPYAQWKASHQGEATPEQMEQLRALAADTGAEVPETMRAAEASQRIIELRANS